MKARRVTVLIATVLAAGAAAVVLTGCPTSITPPPDPADPVAVFLLDYGRHSSLVLPASDEAVPDLVEYAYGDWDWYALDNSAWYDVFPTLFWPTQGALGRRTLTAAPAADLRRSLGCESVHEITVDAAAARDLAASLDARFARHADTLHHQPLYDLDFVIDGEPFHAFSNCNHAVARWLRALDCDVRGLAMFADFVVRPAAGEPGP